MGNKDEYNELLNLILTNQRQNRIDKSTTDSMADYYSARLTSEYLKVPKDVLDALYEILIDEKYLIRKESGWEYRITGKGIIFIENGGYIQQKKESNRHKKIENLHRFVLTTGTGLAGLYGLKEILVFLHMHFCN
jgi:hypothetical protein